METLQDILTLFGYFDFLILGVLIFFNIKSYGKINWKIGCWMGSIVFGFVLPFISMSIELAIVTATKGGWMDNFEVLYVYLRFPMYWIMGIIQCIIIGLSTNKKNEFN